MASKLILPPIPSPHVAYPSPTRTKIPRCLIIPLNNRSSRFDFYKSICITKVTEQSSGSGFIEDNERERETDTTSYNIKQQLYHAVQGINRGIFGVPSTKKSEIEYLVQLLESQNPTPDPILNIHKVNGSWKLVYSTITVLGSKRTKLGLRDFITLGDFTQIIDAAQGKATNVIKFHVRGLKLFNGQLTIQSSFKIASNSRVDIKTNSSTIIPDQLMNIFRKNYDLLLGIFNPEGWLEISYVDETLKIGRDDKGNIFVLERLEEN